LPDHMVLRHSDGPVPVNTPAEILEICNRVREAGGGELLEALMPGHTLSQDSCLIARNLNFSCRVINTMNGWVMAVPVCDQDLAERIAGALGSEQFAKTFFGYAIVLPEALGNAAAAFDQRLLPEGFYA
jgi:hypothetical protein